MIKCNYKLVPYACTILLLTTTACTHWTPRVDQYGLPDHQYSYQQPEEINDGWETVSVADTNIDPDVIIEMMKDFMSGNDRNIHSILIVKDKKLVFEEYFYGYNREKRHYLASVSKSITSILVGIALEQHQTANVKTMTYDFFPTYDYTKWVDQKYPVTLEHVLTMAAGLEWEAGKYSRRDPRHTTHRIYDSDDPIRFVLDRNLKETPGAKFYYNSGLTILLGEIVKHFSGLSIDDFAGKYLFSPLGITDFQWDKFADGRIQTDGGLSLRPRDMAKIGQTILDGGTWKGKQVVSKDWVVESTTKRIDALGAGYGYQWWLAETKNYDQAVNGIMATGHGGQKIFIVPKYDLVVVFTSKVFNPKGHTSPEGFLLRYIIPAVDSSLTYDRTVQLPQNLLNKFVGRYRSDELDHELPLIRRGNHLFVQENFWRKVEIKPISETRFFGDSKQVGKFNMEFFMNRDGNVDHLLAYLGFRVFKFDKIE
jgi:CubicO group peptidase (beta-lactamase class C family)